MKTKPVLELADVKAILSAAEAEATKNNWVVSIAVVDDGGNLLGMIRRDGAAPVSAHICQAKARTAALGRRDTKGYEDMINGGRTAFLSAPVIDGMLEGGLRVGYKTDRYDVAAFARNITNDVSAVGGIDFNNLTGFVNEPRIWGVELGVKW